MILSEFYSNPERYLFNVGKVMGQKILGMVLPPQKTDETQQNDQKCFVITQPRHVNNKHHFFWKEDELQVST